VDIEEYYNEELAKIRKLKNDMLAKNLYNLKKLVP